MKPRRRQGKPIKARNTKQADEETKHFIKGIGSGFSETGKAPEITQDIDLCRYRDPYWRGVLFPELQREVKGNQTPEE